MVKKKIEYEKLTPEEKKILDDIKALRKNFNVLKNKGTWKHLYTMVRSKTIELEKKEDMTSEEKLKEFKAWYNDEFNFKPIDKVIKPVEKVEQKQNVGGKK